MMIRSVKLIAIPGYLCNQNCTVHRELGHGASLGVACNLLLRSDSATSFTLGCMSPKLFIVQVSYNCSRN
jgi:hypothetical protein